MMARIPGPPSVRIRSERSSWSKFLHLLALQEARLTKLETGMQEPRTQNAKFEDWFSKFGQQVSHTSAKVQEVTQVVAQQQQEPAHLRGEVAKQADVVQTAVGQMQRDLNAQISAQFTA